MPQPDVTLSGVVVGATIVATWSPKGYARNISRLRITGPAASEFDIYVGMINDLCKVGTTTRGDANQADFTNPLPVPAGIVCYFVWSGYSVVAPSTVTIGYDRG